MADDGRLAAAIATAAGRALSELRQRFTTSDLKDPRALKDAGDRLGHALITATLKAYRPEDAVLSEEGADDAARLNADRVWIVDPLDGTREFSEPPRDDWAIHVALWERRDGAVDGDPVGELTAGAVALPAKDLTLATYDVPVLAPARSGRPRFMVSRTRPPAEAEHVASELGGELVPMGSAGAKAMAVLLGEGDAYVHSGGQYEWDSAAPVAVARAAGLHCSRIDGSPLVYNQANTRLPDLVICRPELADGVLAALAAPAAPA
ncbi:MAG TPA: 3'(2'),5'-bisphosphate nucleotidase CysQ [Actinomycetes bacterium]|nr:3'(2'),5'-bisphosphate nucleotidase CysQ [Actinomycetes bacterium]